METLYRLVSGLTAGFIALFAPIGPLVACAMAFIGIDFLSGVAASRAAARRKGHTWYFESCEAWRTVLKLGLTVTAIAMAWLIDSCVLDFMQLNVARVLHAAWSCGRSSKMPHSSPMHRCSIGCAGMSAAVSERRRAMSRGLQNCNPGNIRQSKVRYKGEVRPSRDSAFKQFESLAWGYRAIFVLLDTYRIRYGLDTIRGMISRWAPPSENHTETYIRAVADAVGIPDGQPLDTRDRTTMLRMAAAVSRVENGAAADMGEVELGWELFVRDKPASG